MPGWNAEDLIREAIKARELAYCPYSGFSVGAALLSGDDRIIRGCNIENASYGATMCAERTAFYQAVSQGIRRFRAIAIVGGPAGKDPEEYAYPCGMCRQVMGEFCDDDFQIIVAKNGNDYRRFSLRELFPNGFDQKQLQ